MQYDIQDKINFHSSVSIPDQKNKSDKWSERLNLFSEIGSSKRLLKHMPKCRDVSFFQFGDIGFICCKVLTLRQNLVPILRMNFEAYIAI